MPVKKHELKKLSDKEVNGLKGKLLEVRRIGAHPIFVSVTKKDKVSDVLKKADIPYGNESDLKIEAIKDKAETWEVVKLNVLAHKFSKIAITTKVSGAC